MKNFKQHGDTLDLTAPSGGVISGTGYLIGALFGVAVVSADAGVTFPLRVVGVYTLPKATGEAWTEGALVYWDNTNKRLTTTSSGNTKVGTAVSAAASGDTTGIARLNGVA
jgi:predicted RecA/RadA family phage recombinase